METKKLFSLQKKVSKFLANDEVEKALFMLSSFCLALLTTRGLAFGNSAPFSVSFTAAVPKKFLFSAVVGSVLGYLLPSAVYMPFRYIATVLAVSAIRWALGELKKISKSQLFAPIVSFVALLSTGLCVSLIDISSTSSPALFVAEAFLSAGASFFFCRSIKIIYEKKYTGVFDNIDIACLSVSIGIIILSTNDIEIYDISIGRIFMILLVLICAGSGGIAGGAISGVAAGAIGGLSGFGVSYLSGAYGLGGLMAGIFSGVSKAFGAIVFIIAHGVASIQIDNDIDVVSAAIEVAIATVVYMLLPQSRRIEALFVSRREKLSGDSLRNSLIMRLNHSSKALTCVAESVDEISQKLSESARTKPSHVFNQATSEICAGCSLRAVCWRKNKAQSIDAFSVLLPYLKAKGEIDIENFPDYFKERCGRATEMKNSINRFYKLFLERQIAEIRSENIRDIAAEQFKVTSAMLGDMASEISLYDSFDEEAAKRVIEIFRKMEINPVEVSCRMDRHSRMTIEAEIEKTRDTKLNKNYLVKEVSRACGRIFSPPCISNAQYSYKLQMCQKPLYDIAIGMAQESASELCGDSAISFYDGQGHYIAIISDGMGTGGMAAVDGSMASSIIESLLKAGIGYDTALRMVNSALMSKSEDETLATIDIASIDLHTGRCEFRKAGATMSFIKKGKRCFVIEEDSLPVGIMPEVRFSLSLENLKKGDVIVLLSDGATSFGTDWIEEEIDSFDGTDPNELAREIVLYAKRCRNDGHADDITALVIMVCSNEKDY
ncbi:MAG: SpoIIE family protein phosphatase [Clostridia bacterium]